MAVTRTWKVYGVGGHRQSASFMPSFRTDTPINGRLRIVEVLNSDQTGTNKYSLIRITRETAQECEDELLGQLQDGYFENILTGFYEEVADCPVAA